MSQQTSKEPRRPNGAELFEVAENTLGNVLGPLKQRMVDLETSEGTANHRADLLKTKLLMAEGVVRGQGEEIERLTKECKSLQQLLIEERAAKFEAVGGAHSPLGTDGVTYPATAKPDVHEIFIGWDPRDNKRKCSVKVHCGLCKTWEIFLVQAQHGPEPLENVLSRHHWGLYDGRVECKECRNQPKGYLASAAPAKAAAPAGETA